MLVVHWWDFYDEYTPLLKMSMDQAKFIGDEFGPKTTQIHCRTKPKEMDQLNRTGDLAAQLGNDMHRRNGHLRMILLHLAS